MPARNPYPENGCPFLRIASEYPDTAHQFHRIATEHENKFHAYLFNLLAPIAIDKTAAAAMILSVIDGAFSLQMLYGNSKGGSDSLARRGRTQELSESLNATTVWPVWRKTSITKPIETPCVEIGSQVPRKIEFIF